MNLTVKIGKGVLGKDGRAFAAKTIHGSDGQWNIPVPYTMEALVSLLVNPKILTISIITESNRELTLT